MLSLLPMTDTSIASSRSACSAGLIAAASLKAFKEDCGLDLQLGKCKLYIKGTSLAEARALVRSIINAEPGLSSISDMLHVHEEQSKNVIQVDGITCVGVPIG